MRARTWPTPGIAASSLIVSGGCCTMWWMAALLKLRGGEDGSTQLLSLPIGQTEPTQQDLVPAQVLIQERDRRQTEGVQTEGGGSHVERQGFSLVGNLLAHIQDDLVQQLGRLRVCARPRPASLRSSCITWHCVRRSPPHAAAHPHARAGALEPALLSDPCPAATTARQASHPADEPPSPSRAELGGSNFEIRMGPMPVMENCGPVKF